MLDDTYSGGITSAFRWCMPDATPVRIARDAWITSSGNDCGNEQPRPDPRAPIMAVGQYHDAGYTFTERDDSFDDILARLQRAFPGFRSGRINYFPVAVHDYYFLNPSGTPAGNRIVAINEDRLRSFDAFLDNIDRYVSRRDPAVCYQARCDAGLFLVATDRPTDEGHSFAGRQAARLLCRPCPLGGSRTS